MTKQLKAEVERLWKHVQELKDKLMAEQQINFQLRGDIKRLKKEIGYVSQYLSNEELTANERIESAQDVISIALTEFK